MYVFFFSRVSGIDCPCSEAVRHNHANDETTVSSAAWDLRSWAMCDTHGCESRVMATSEGLSVHFLVCDDDDPIYSNYNRHGALVLGDMGCGCLCQSVVVVIPRFICHKQTFTPTCKPFIIWNLRTWKRCKLLVLIVTTLRVGLLSSQSFSKASSLRRIGNSHMAEISQTSPQIRPISFRK
jgi:hypothetical protein